MRNNSGRWRGVVSFIYKLIPNNDNCVKVFFLNLKIQLIAYPNTYKAIKNFIASIDEKEISIQGFNIEISNGFMPPVDFREHYYVFYTRFAFQRLAFDRGMKSVKKQGKFSYRGNRFFSYFFKIINVSSM